MNYRSSQAEIYKALRQRLARNGVAVGETAGYPRVEIHSFAENAPTDKDGQVRSVSVIVESMSAQSYGHAVAMNEENLDRLLQKAGTFLGMASLSSASSPTSSQS